MRLQRYVSEINIITYTAAVSLFVNYLFVFSEMINKQRDCF